MKAEVVALIRPEVKTSVAGRVTYCYAEALEDKLCADLEFMKKVQECSFDWPNEGVPISSLANWLLEETERSGDAERAVSKLDKFLAAPRKTWRHAVVCTDVTAQHIGVDEGWEFCNEVVAYAAGLSEDYMILSDDSFIGRGLIFLDMKEGGNHSDFIARVTDCCRSLSFVAGEGCFLRPSYHTYVFERAAPHPLGTSKGWLSHRRNMVLTLLTGEMFNRADDILQRMRNVADKSRAVLGRVLDRHAGAVVWGDIENRAIEARICMEMVLMGGSKGDNAFKISRRAAYLMEDELSQRKIRMEQARNLYSAGSSAVHQGMLTKQKEITAVRNCHEFLQNLVTAWLTRHARILDDTEWAVVELGGEFPDC